MRKIILIITTIILALTFISCDERQYQREDLNENDTRDFYVHSSTIKFELIQFKNIIDEKTINNYNINATAFLFLANANGTSSNSKEVVNKYYGYVRNKYGAIYFAEIPANLVRIYEDSEVPYLVANSAWDHIDPEEENLWDRYRMFNLHVPKGTIIPKVDLNFNLDDIK